MIPTGILGVQVLVRAWVPIDDEHLMFWSILAPRSREGGGGAGSAQAVTNGGRPPAFEFLPDSPDWLGKFRLTQNEDNDYLIDREAQRTRSFTGIAGIHQQDQAVTESMGPIIDRTEEHLGTSDAMVIRTRRRAINAAKALRDDGVVPPGVDEPAVYRYRSGGVILPRNADWLEETKELRKAFVQHKPEATIEPQSGR
jgi:Rieske oxygenase family protein